MINSYYQDTNSVDIGRQFESLRSEKPGATLVRHKIMGSAGNISNIESIINIENPQQAETNQKQATLQRPQNLMNRVNLTSEYLSFIKLHRTGIYIV